MLFRSRIPNSIGERAIVERLAADCEQHQLRVIEFQSPQFQRCNNLECTRIALTAECSWTSLCSFLSDCKASRAIVSIDELTIDANKESVGRLSVTLTIADWASIPHQLTTRGEGSLR